MGYPLLFCLVAALVWKPAWIAWRYIASDHPHTREDMKRELSVWWTHVKAVLLPDGLDKDEG